MINIFEDIQTIIYDNLSTILSLRNTKVLKDDNSYVSKGDLLCEKLIYDYIKENIHESYIIISEESFKDIKDIDNVTYIFTIDPIDGTENFVSGLKEWGIGISIYKDMKHYKSMLFLPELQLCLKTGDKINKIENSRICGLPSYMHEDNFKDLDNSYEYRITGCCMYNMYNVIYGHYKRFYHVTGCYSWDLLPGLNIALEQGLKVYINNNEYNGEYLMPNIKYKVNIEN